MVESNRKLSLKVLTTLFVIFCLVSAVFAFTGKKFNKAAAADETVEVMNDRFSVTVGAYRGDFATDQIIYLNYDKQIVETAGWLNDHGGLVNGIDFGNYLVINGKTFNEIKEAEAGKYPSVDQRTQMSKGGVWTPVAACVETNRIRLDINRGYADVGAMTVGIKDGFSYEYNGTTFKVEGDLMFRATIVTDNVATPVFQKVEDESATEALYANNRNVEADAAHAVYTGFRTFPLLNATNALNTGKYVSGRCLADNYMYMKEYIKVNGKSVNYWNIVEYDDTLTYTTNPVNNSGRVYSMPIVTQIMNNGEYKVWIHTEWAAKVGIDLDNFTIEFAEGMPFVDTNGNVCRAVNSYVATRTDGKWNVKLVREEIMNDHFTGISIDANGYRSDWATDQIIYLNYDKQFHGTAAWLNDKTDGKADGLDLGNYLVINGKTFNEIKAEEAGKYLSVDNRTPMLQKGGIWTPISVLADTTQIKLEVNRGYADIGAMTVGIKDGFSYEYNGTTYKTVGDIMFKATVTSDNVATPVFQKVEDESVTEALYANNRGVEADAAHAVYTGFRTFPLYGATNALNTGKYVSGRCLADNYMYMKEYIKVNGKSVNYWNIVEYDDTLTYTTNPVGNSGRVYSMPIVTQIMNNGEFKVWIHTEWAAKVGIDLDNFTIEFAEGMPFVDTSGNVCRTTGLYKAIRTNGTWKVNGLTSPGAAVRLKQFADGQKDSSAIRFAFETAAVLIDEYLNADGTFKDGVSSGVMLIPKDILGSETLDVANGNSKIERVALAADEWEADGNVKVAKVYLYNFPKSQYGREISARAYITDGNKTIYSDVVTRSMEYVAKSYLLDDNVTSEANKLLAERYVSNAIIDLADYVESGMVTVNEDEIVKQGVKYELLNEGRTYIYENDAWSYAAEALTLSDKEFITIADFPPKLRDDQGYEGTWQERLQDYADLGFSTVLLTEDDYAILDKKKDANGNYTDEDVLGELNGAYKIIIERLISSGLDVWVRNYNNQGDYFSSKELTTNFQEYGKVTGFYMSDEPFTTNDLAINGNQPGVAMDSYGGLITWKNEYYPDDFWHINLVPSDSYNHWENGADGKDGGYGDYIQYYIDNVLKQLTSGGRTVCLDCYPFRETGKNGVYTDFLFDLLTAANKTRDYNKTAAEGQKATFGMCVQTYAFYGGSVKTKQRNIVSAEEVTFQLYTGMALGAGMFEYFAYSSDYSVVNGVGKGYDCITTTGGEHTSLYNYVKNANDKALKFSKFINAYEWQGATYSAGTAENENATGFAMVDGLTLSGSETGRLTAYSSDYDALIGCFKQNGKDGYMVTNFTDPQNKKTTNVELTFENCTKAAVYMNGKLVTVGLNNGTTTITLLPGNAAFVMPF